MSDTKTLAAVIAPIVVALIAISLGVAYQQGKLDPLIEKLGVYFFKAKAKAEEKELQARGKKEGEDFVAGELKGNKQAGQVAQGLGGVDGLKKAF